MLGFNPRPSVPSLIVPPFSNWAWGPWGNTGALGGALAVTAARRYFFPLTPLDKAVSLQRLMFNITTFTAGGGVRLGVYASRAGANLPGAPVLLSPEHTSVANGAITLTAAAPYTFQPNTLYWGCFCAQNAISVNQIAFGHRPLGLHLSAATGLTALTKDVAYGALVDESAEAFAAASTAGSPAIWIALPA